MKQRRVERSESIENGVISHGAIVQHPPLEERTLNPRKTHDLELHWDIRHQKPASPKKLEPAWPMESKHMQTDTPKHRRCKGVLAHTGQVMSSRSAVIWQDLACCETLLNYLVRMVLSDCEMIL